MVKIIDTRHSIIEKCKKAGYDAVQGDYFDLATEIPHHVLATASNPHFTFGGGIDATFLELFPHYCKAKRRKQGGNERIGNIIFLVSVDFSLDSNEALVRDALQFAKENTLRHETLCLSAIGTGIGRLHEETFIEILQEVFTNP